MPFVSEDLNALFAEFKILEKFGFRHTYFLLLLSVLILLCLRWRRHADVLKSLLLSLSLSQPVCICSRTPHFPISCVTQAIPDPVSLRLPVSLPTPDSVCNLTSADVRLMMQWSHHVSHDTKITVTSIGHQNPPVCCCCAHCCVI